jgi:hypothetical protein
MKVPTSAYCEALTGRFLGYKHFPIGSIVYWTPDSKSIVFPAIMGSSVRLVPLNFKSGGPVIDGGLAGNPWQDQKVLRNLEDCFEALSHMLAPENIESIKNAKEDGPKGGFFLGMGLRNEWGLREHNPLVEYFNRYGVTDGGDMSGIIITSYWRHLNGRPIEFEELCRNARSYRDDVVAQQTAVVTGKRMLPKELLEFESDSKSGAKISIARLTGRARVVSYIPKIFPGSLNLLQTLECIREKYPPEKVSIVVFTFPPESVDSKYPNPSVVVPGQDDPPVMDSCGIKAIEAFLEHTKLPVAAANPNVLKSLQTFAGRYLTIGNNGLPQTLILDENNQVVIRLNGWDFFDKPNPGPLQDAIDTALSSSNGKNGLR